MKIRLLKKIRKQYSIIRVDKLASDADEFMIRSKNFWGLPFSFYGIIMVMVCLIIELKLMVTYKMLKIK